jgi:hypothetical protein
VDANAFLEKPMPLHENLRYPIFLIEKKAQKYAIFDIAHTKGDFVVGSRMPARKKYVDGYLFDSLGTVYEYKGSSGWPRFGEYSKPVLEVLILPALFAKLLSRYIYFGPKLVAAKNVNEAEFRELLLSSLKPHVRPKARPQIALLLSEARTYEDMIKAIDWWRYYGGKRDEDGHPIEEGEA